MTTAASPFDMSAPKKPTSLTINADLLQQAKLLKINISQVLEQSLAEAVRDKRRQQWLAENREALADANEFAARRGVFSDGVRRF